MRCRHFTLRLTAEHATDDESNLNEFLQSVQVHTIQTAPGLPGLWSVLIFYEETPNDAEPTRRPARASSPIQAGSSTTDGSELTPEQERVYERLREWRTQRAATEGKPAYVIAHNAVLKEIARRHMTLHATDDLLAISQLGPARTARDGPDIIDLLITLARPDETPLHEDER